MKLLHWAAVVGCAVMPATASSQGITGIGRRTTGSDIGTKPEAAKTETSVTVKLGPARAWKNVEGTTITAELVSWPVTDPKAATADPATLKFDIVRNGQVRLRKGGKISVLALTRLSEADRAYVSALEASTKKGAKTP